MEYVIAVFKGAVGMKERLTKECMRHAGSLVSVKKAEYGRTLWWQGGF